MKLTLQQLEAHLWGAANILRGKTAGQDYKNYILSLMFYKRLCDQWEWEADDAIAAQERQQGRPLTEPQKAIFRKRGEHRYAIPGGSRWGDVKAVSVNIGEALTRAMRAVADANEELRGVFTVDWNQPAPDGSGKPLIANEVVHALVQHFDEHDLSNRSVPADVLGRAYEYLIKKFADDAGAKAGEFFTPPEVVDTLVRILEPHPGDTIYDPTSGSGGMLVHAADYLRERGHLATHARYFAQEMNWSNAAIGKINSVLHGLEADIRAGNSTITDPQFLEDGEVRKFSLVLANFPFSDDYWWLKPEQQTDDKARKARLRKEIFGKEGYKDPFGRFGRGTGFQAPPAGYGDYAFILHILASLSDEGRAGIVCPQGVLFRGQPEVEEETGDFDAKGNPKVKRRKADDEHLIRRALLESQLIDAVVSLPLNVFYGAGVPACLLILRKQRPVERRDQVLLIYAARHYRELSAQNELRPQDVMRMLVHYHAYGDASKVPGLVKEHSERINGEIGRRQADEVGRLESCDYPNVEKALGVHDLKQRLRTDWRGTLVTTLQSFQKMDDLDPLSRDNIVSLVDECHRSQTGTSRGSRESHALTMRVKLRNGFRFGFTGTPIDRTLQNTHRDFGPRKDGVQERYLSYYGIRRSIQDGATLEVHYVRDNVPIDVDEKPLSIGFEQICAEMELEDEEAKDFVQRQRAQWKELVRHPDRVSIVLDKLLAHFLAHPDPSGFKAQLVAVDRKACAIYKDALDHRLLDQGLPPEMSDVIISSAQNSEPDVERFEYAKAKQDELIDYFKLTPAQWEDWNRERHGDDRSQWRPPLKILIVCDRLLTGFDAPVEQVMYLDKPLRDHNLLQAIARTNRPQPSMKKRTGIVVDYFGVFADLERALNFDESVREESLIDWDKLRETVPGEVSRCMETFEGIAIEDTRECLLSALRRLRDSEAAKNFEQNFRSLERLWEAVSPDPCLYPHRLQYNWLCGIYVAHRRRQRGSKGTYGELSAKTKELIEENTTFVEMAQSLPVLKIDQDYAGKLDELPTPADKAAALEAMLTAELTEDDPSFLYRLLGERLQKIKERQETDDEAAAKRLRELEAIAGEAGDARLEPERLGLTQPGEYGLFTILRVCAPATDETHIAECARNMVGHLRRHRLLVTGWSNSVSGRMGVEQSLLAESWNPRYERLGFDSSAADPPFLKPAVEELAKSDGVSDG